MCDDFVRVVGQFILRGVHVAAGVGVVCCCGCYGGCGVMGVVDIIDMVVYLVWVI